MIGIDSKRIKEKGITLLEAIVSTAIVGIGFIAVFQMVNYSVQSIDVSGERTKTNYLVSMVAEDLIGDRFSTKGKKKVYEYLADETNTKDHVLMMRCGKSNNNPYKGTDIAIDNKLEKWKDRLGPKQKDTFSGRIKCRGVNDIKKLTVYEICKDKVKVDGIIRSSCHYNNDDVFDKIYIGRMEANLNNGEKQQFIYFQIY